MLPVVPAPVVSLPFGLVLVLGLARPFALATFALAGLFELALHLALGLVLALALVALHLAADTELINLNCPEHRLVLD